MRRITYNLTLVCLALGFSAEALAAAPKAGPVASSWQLDFVFYDPQRLTLTLPGDSEPTTFWYFLYRVTNNTGQDREFYPSFRLMTDTLQVIEGGSGVSPHVYDVIKAQHKLEFPFLAPPTRITGPLLQGRENARASVAVFRDFDRKASGFTVFAAGLSGDIARATNPAFDKAKGESKSNPRFFMLRRTLAVGYDFPGDPTTRGKVHPVRRSREWVMR